MKNEFEPAVRYVDNLETLDLALCEGRIGKYEEDCDSEVFAMVVRTGDYQVSLLLCKNDIDCTKLAEMVYRIVEPSVENSGAEYYDELKALWDAMQRMYEGEWNFFSNDIGVYVPSGAPELTKLAWEAENEVW